MLFRNHQSTCPNNFLGIVTKVLTFVKRVQAIIHMWTYHVQALTHLSKDCIEHGTWNKQVEPM